MNMKIRTLSHIGILLLNVFIIIYWFFGFDGFYFFDDLTYAKNAIQLIDQTFSFSDNLFSQRLSLIGATALSYYFFGFSDYVTILPPLICTLITCNAIYFFLYKKSFVAALLAASVYALDFYTIFFSNKLYPDVLVGCFVLLGLIVLYMARKNPEKTFFKAFLVVITLFIAFLAKLTVLYVFPFLLALSINDLLKKQNVRLWSYVVGMSVVIGGGYLYWQFWTFGDFLFRFKSIIHEGHYVSNDSYFDKNGQALLKRMTYQPIGMLLHSSMIIPVGLAFPSLVGFRAGKFWQHTPFEKYWAYAALSILLYFWWGSTSWQYYNPIALFQRHLLVLVPPLAILSGISLMRMNEHAGLYAIVFCGITLSGLWVKAGPVTGIYGLLFGVFIIYRILQYVNQIGQRWQYMFFSSLLFILIIHPVYSMIKPSVSGYSHLAAMVEKLAEKGENVLFIADRQIAANCAYVFRRWNQQPVCMSFSQLHSPAVLSDFEEVYVLKYDFHLPFYGEDYDNLLQMLEGNAIQIQAIDSIGNVHLLKVNSSMRQTTEDGS